jgi:hypothetical protein
MLKIYIAILMILAVVSYCFQENKKGTVSGDHPENLNQSSGIFTHIGTTPKLNLDKTRKKAQEALAFCKQKNMNTQFCILIDMGMHSGLNRFLVWDFQKDTLKYSFPVSHGYAYAYAYGGQTTFLMGYAYAYGGQTTFLRVLWGTDHVFYLDF